VEDDGPGFDPRLIDRVFDPFFSTRAQGRGLGLSSVLGIVKAHHGAIQLDRSSFPSGASIRLYFPCPVRQTVPPPRQGQPSIKNRKVLIVDDEPIILDLMEDALKDLDLIAQRAIDGQEAVEAVQQDPEGFALILMDISMPRMDGREAFLRIKAIHANQRVILCSGYSAHDLQKDFSPMSPDGFLEKPFRLSIMREMVQKALGCES
jgi:CheY-like chemotaxis protein